MSNTSGPAAAEARRRGAFSSRKVFIFAAIGSAVGLGNIWRFPNVAYENGGGAFMVPYMVALLTAGIPFLYLDYALGHRTRGSAPLAFRRMSRNSEWLGWWQVGICAVIAVYYAAIIAWALQYTIFSVDKKWGDNPNDYFFGDFLEAADITQGLTLDVVPAVLVPLLLVWVAVIAIMAFGVQKGIGATSIVFIPVLVIAFVALVIRALFLPGAADGLDSLFTPNWEALTHAGVWAAAYGQIFFSLSIGFGIMITYSSYVGRKTDMTGSGAVVGFANSSFELLCGIGVFSALGFMAQAQGLAVDEVADDGIGLAFIAFPTIINEAPAGALIGVLFFGSLILAGITSMVSIIEVIISAVRDKFELSRITATMIVTVPAAVISLFFFSTTTAIFVLDTADKFINSFGILLVAVVSMLVLAWGVRALPSFADHLNAHGTVPVRMWWQVLIAWVTPLALAVVLAIDFVKTIDEPYEGYPSWLLNTFGWGLAAAVVVLGVLASRVPWRPETSLTIPAADLEKEVQS